MLFEVKNLSIKYNTLSGSVYAVTDLSFSLDTASTLGIVGESGSGKTQAMLALMGLLPKNAQISGQVLLDGRNILGLSVKELNKIRGNEISMIFQDHMTSLNPYLKIETQMMEVLETHKKIGEAEAQKKVMSMLDLLRIADSKNKIKSYPHELSGGMRQRIMIGIALLSEPRILIADEPTTALDVTIQAQIIRLLTDLRSSINTTIVLITHDLGVVAGIADNVLVMYGGRAMEYGTAEEIYLNASHPYTVGLLKAIPRIDVKNDNLIGIPGQPRSKYQNIDCCPFHDRCFYAYDRCQNESPTLEGDLHKRACFVDESKVRSEPETILE